MPASARSLSIAADLSLSRPLDLEQIFDRYMESVYRFLYSRLGNREDAEDLTSEVFLKASRMLDKERPESSAAAWLFMVARTVLADHWRRYYREGAPVALDENHAISPSESASNVGRSEAIVRDMLAALPERYRQVLELRFLRGYSIAEVARDLDITPANVKVIQHRALIRAATVVPFE
ncbi:MAG: RNA polymerase sigma factor [Chloroflexota bacterium]